MKSERLVKNLVADLQDGRVTIVTGTGLSVAATGNQEVDGYKVATWPGLLLHGLQHCRELGVVDDFDVDMLTKQINSGRADYVVAAGEAISNKMRTRSLGVYRGWLKNTLGSLVVANSALVEAIGALPGVLATLNYDSLIEDVTGRSPVTWLQTDEVEEVLNGRHGDSVLHLHGWYREPDSVVLGSTSYMTVKDHPHAKSVLQHFTIGRTLLFIGCGSTFDDPNFSQLIKWGREAVADVTPRHYVLCRSSEISQIQKILLSAPWLQPLAYGDDYENLTPFLRSLITEKTHTRSRHSRVNLDLEGYRKAMLTRYKRLKIEQLDTTTHDIRPLTLSAMYIEQHAKECTTIVPRVFELPKELQHQLQRKGELEDTALDDATLAQYKRAYLDGAPRLVSDILADASCQKAVILGDPGSGKSTLLQHVLLQWAESSAGDLAAHPLPLLIELREFARFRKQTESGSFLAYLEEGAGVRWHLQEDALASWLRGKHSLVLFDGLDEIFDLAQRREITTTIHRFAHEFPLVRVVVTSRVVGYQHQAWNDEGFRQFMLQDLDQEQIATFLQRWHRAAYEEVLAGEKKRLLLAQAINDSAAIRQLAGNPLLLTMMAVLNRTQDLPRDRAELYEQCARLLLHQWKIDVAFQTDPDLANASLDFKDKRGLLLRVARAMHSGEHGLAGNLIDEETLEHTLAGGLNEIRFSLPARAARSLIEQLRGRNFMLCFMGGHSYAFVHRTFLEYFCAVEIRERFEREHSLSLDQLKQEVYGHWGDETWHEVLCLLAGMISAKFAEKVIQWLMGQRDPNNTRHHNFVALRCASEVRNRSTTTETESTLRRIAKNMSLFESSFPVEPWMPEGQAVNEVRERALKMMSVVWPDSKDNVDWFKNLALSSGPWALRELALRLLVQGWREDGETLVWLKGQARSEKSRGMITLALTELARNWPNDPEVFSIAESTFLSRKDESARAAGLTALAMLRRDDPAMLQRLLNVATSDESVYVSYVAIQEMSEKWRGDPRVLSTLLSMARSSDERRQHVSLQTLSHYWRDEPEAFELCYDMARTTKKSRVLEFAAILMFMEWRDKPAVISLAKEIARAPGDVDSRIHAIDLLVAECRGEPETLEILMFCANSADAGRVRPRAVRHLEHWLEDEGVRNFLQNLLHARNPFAVRQAALRALAQEWRKKRENDNPLFDIARTEKSVLLRKTAIDELDVSGHENSQTLELFKTILCTDVSAEVRARALQALAPFANNNSEVYSLLVMAVESKQPTVARIEALRVIVQQCAAYPDTLPLLKRVALSDKNAEVRLPATAEIGRRGNEDPEVLGLLKKIVRKDRSKVVRLRAMRELARGWPADTEAVQYVLEREKSDANKDVRQAAAVELVRLRADGFVPS
jgi:hypothetical protein